MKDMVVALDVRCIGQQNTGDTSYWTGLVHAFARSSENVTYLLYSNAAKPPGIPESDRLHWIHLPANSSRWWSWVKFPLAARRVRAQVLHTQYNLSPLAKGGVTTIHDVSFFANAEWFQPRDRELLQRFVPASARRAARVLTVSEFSRAEIQRYIPGIDEKLRVAPNACGDDVMPVDRNRAQDQVHRELGVEAPYLFTVGTRWPRKNMSLAIRAVEGLPSTVPHRLVVTGKPGWGQETAGGRTVFTGFVTNELRNALYSGADLYLAPALYEGFGITLLEAFRCGCPVLASDIGAHREISGSAALLVDPQPGLWSSTLSRLLGVQSGNLDSMREAGRLQESKFSWDASARLTLAVYREVAG